MPRRRKLFQNFPRGGAPRPAAAGKKRRRAGNSETVSKTICFVTGTRAEFGLMRTTLQAIRRHPNLRLRIVATGMHLDRRLGHSVDRIAASGQKPDAVVPWEGPDRARATGLAIAGLAQVFEKLKPDVVLVVGDRVEAFAAAAAAHLRGIVVAHVHGGDRAMGQIDDSLRHAITKLSHIHFPATRQSAQRLARLGEDAWRIRHVGSPAVDGIVAAAAPRAKIRRAFPMLRTRKFALLVLHPSNGDEITEFRNATIVALALGLAQSPLPHTVVIYPNNDPGSRGVLWCWQLVAQNKRLKHFIIRRDISRELFLGLLRDAAVLVGNSSSGIIEAGSFGTPVIDIGDRQRGRQRGPGVRHVPYNRTKIERALQTALAEGSSRTKRARRAGKNIYGPMGAGAKIAQILSKMAQKPGILTKLIAY